MAIRLRSTFLAAVLVFSVAIFGFCNTFDSSALSRACQNSQACLEAAAAEDKANADAAAASATADAHSAQVAYKNYEIAIKVAQIAETKVRITELIADIDATEAKLTSQQTALAKLLVDMYFNKNNEPVLILAGSDSISDLAEKEAREDAVQSQISAANREVKALKEQLEVQRADAEATLKAQELAEAELETARAELQTLVAKYQADASSFAADAETARLAKIEAERIEQESHPELYRVGSYYGSTNSYEWKNWCPGYQDAFATYHNGNLIGGLVCECVSYAGWKAYENFGVVAAWGNAYSWDDYGRLYFNVDHNPAPNTIGQADGGTYGHVFWVESVNADGSINVTEYNNAWATYLYSGVYQYGDFGARTIPAYEAATYNYIHLDQPK